MQKNNLKGCFILLLTAIIWGASFVSQSLGMEKIDAFTFNGIRTFMGALALLVVILIRDRGFKVDRKLLIHGSILAVIFVFASNFQQFAFYSSTAGKIAFITAMYMFFVPIVSTFMGKKVSIPTWICVFIAIIGLYFLCITSEDSFKVNPGDLLALCCAFCYAFHIIYIDKYSPQHDGLKLSCVQFLIAGVISLILMFIFETPNIGDITSVSMPLLYSGIMSCGVAYTLQIIGQKYTPPTAASIIMCLESVFAVLSAAIFLKEIPTAREAIGCILMFVAIIASQLIEAKKSTVTTKN